MQKRTRKSKSKVSRKIMAKSPAPAGYISELKSLPNTNKLTYYMALIVLVVCNLTVSVVLIPFLIILETVPLYSIVIIFGIMFGALFKLTLESIEGLEIKHKSAATFFIPALAVVNVAVIATIANQMIELLQLESTHDPATLGLVYALAFLLPFIYNDIYAKLKRFL